MPVFSPRERRLRSDRQSLERLKEASSIFDFSALPLGQDAPYEYRVRFSGRGLARHTETGDVYVYESHEVLIRLGPQYPRSLPQLSWLTPIFHPNISSGGIVCLGGYGTHWAPSLQLDELCHMLWDMVRYQNFDVRSPYNREAAAWVAAQSADSFPVDRRTLRDRVAAGNVLSGSSPSSVPAAHVPLANTSVPEIHYLTATRNADSSAVEVVEAEVVGGERSEIFYLE